MGASGHSSRGEGGSGSTTASLAAEKALASAGSGPLSPPHSPSATSPVFSLGTLAFGGPTYGLLFTRSYNSNRPRPRPNAVCASHEFVLFSSSYRFTAMSLHMFASFHGFNCASGMHWSKNSTHLPPEVLCKKLKGQRIAPHTKLKSPFGSLGPDEGPVCILSDIEALMVHSVYSVSACWCSELGNTCLVGTRQWLATLAVVCSTKVHNVTECVCMCACVCVRYTMCYLSLQNHASTRQAVYVTRYKTTIRGKPSRREQTVRQELRVR